MSDVKNPETAVSFADLGVDPALVTALDRGGFTEPFPIQVATLPDAIAGRDVLGRGQTGSGKTLAFGLALVSRLKGRPSKSRQPSGLILVPTRELAMQVNDAIAPFADALRMRTRIVVGGVPYAKQITALDRGVHILIATPGRLMDLVERGSADLSQVQVTVLDEADQMADMGFLPIVREILDLTKPNSQRLLFSATLDRGVDALVKAYMNDPAEHSLSSTSADVNTMEHHVLIVHPEDKVEVATQIASRDGRTIFFVRTQAGADKLAKQMASRGVPVGALHGGKSQAVRTRTLADFKEGRTPALVATNVAARGIHVDDISLVVHIDAPTDPKDYVHRAGRTARAGESGTVVTFAAPRQQKSITSLTKRAGVDADVTRVRPGAQELVDITGAQEPSGVPWYPAPEKRAHKSGPRHFHHRGGSGGGSKPRGRGRRPSSS